MARDNFLGSGLLAEFPTADEMLEATRRLRDRGVVRMDTFTPYPVHGLDEAMGLRKSPVSKIVFAAALCGALLAYWIQWFTNAEVYPLNVGGRPAHAAPAFVLITFETLVLFGGFSALLAVIGLSRLPRYWDPVFDVEGFESASIDRFWVGVDDADPLFDERELTDEFTRLGALRVVPFGGRVRAPKPGSGPAPSGSPPSGDPTPVPGGDGGAS